MAGSIPRLVDALPLELSKPCVSSALVLLLGDNKIFFGVLYVNGRRPIILACSVSCSTYEQRIAYEVDPHVLTYV